MAEYICEIEKEDMHFQRYGELKQRLVRCKDCIHRGDKNSCILAYVADKQNFPLFFYDSRGEWFCADGKQEKKDEGSDKVPDLDKVIKALEVCREMSNPPGWRCTDCTECPYHENGCAKKLKEDAARLMKEKQQSTLGITQTAEGISFTATGSAAEGQARGIILGKGVMHNYLETELVRRNLMTDEIREIFRKAKKDTEDLTMIQN